MVVAGGKRKSDESDGEELLGAAEGAEDEVVELLARSEQEAALNGPGGDLHQAAPFRWQIAQSSSHEPLRRRTEP